MYIVFYNLKILFKWISYTTNRKRRDRRNSKNVGKIKNLNFVFGRYLWGGGEVPKLTSKGRFPSPISSFESPLK